MYKILSLSGGGARGIYQAVYLRALGPSFTQPLCKKFDLIAGTSTGSIVAAGVAFEIDLVEIVDLFKKRAPEIFSARWFSSVRSGPHYSSDPLRAELDKVFGEKRLKEASRPLLIPATVLNRYAPRQFSTFEVPGVVWTDPELKVVDVVMASCAAPSYFSPVKPDHPHEERSYVDGGMWANSPSLVAVISAHYYLKIPLAEMKLLSLGNGEAVQGANPKEFATLRPISKPMISSIFDMMFAAQSKAADELVEMVLAPGNFKRINSTLSERINLDDAARAVSKLPPLAAADAANDVAGIVSFLA